MNKSYLVIPALKYSTWLLLLAPSLSAKEDNSLQAIVTRLLGKEEGVGDRWEL